MSQAMLTAWSASEHERVASDTRCVWLALGVAAERSKAQAATTPARVVLAIDRSSSMEGARLETAIRAARAMVEMMRDGDELGLITFDANVTVEAPVAVVTPHLRAELHARLAHIKVGRGTALAEAATRALELARKPAPSAEGRVILLTDGYPFGGETRPEVIVQGIGRAARDAVLSSVGIGHDLDAPLLASMAEVGFGRFLHIASDEDPVGALGGEIFAAQQTVTRRVHVAIQLRVGEISTHGGVVDASTHGRSASFWLPPLVANEPVVFPLQLSFPTHLPIGRTQIGLATLHAERIGAPEVVLEVPLELDVAARASDPDARVVRARCLYEASQLMRRVAATEPTESHMHDLVALAGRIAGRAELSGLSADPALRDVIELLSSTAQSLVGQDPEELPIAAWALALGRAYDPSCGTRPGAPLRSLARDSQTIGTNTAIRLLEALLAGRDGR